MSPPFKSDCPALIANSSSYSPLMQKLYGAAGGAPGGFPGAGGFPGGAPGAAPGGFPGGEDGPSVEEVD
jgi:heat shock protein 1/8